MTTFENTPTPLLRSHIIYHPCTSCSISAITTSLVSPVLTGPLSHHSQLVWYHQLATLLGGHPCKAHTHTVPCTGEHFGSCVPKTKLHVCVRLFTWYFNMSVEVFWIIVPVKYYFHSLYHCALQIALSSRFSCVAPGQFPSQRILSVLMHMSIVNYEINC